MTYPNLSQYQTFLRNAGKLDGKGYFVQKALFEAMQRDGVFDNLEINGIFMQDQELSTEQFMTLNNIKEAILIRARELIAIYETTRELDRSYYGITPEEQVQSDMQHVKEQMEKINKALDNGIF
jgi:hypothetical protein